jgi:hypothetical protein
MRPLATVVLALTAVAFPLIAEAQGRSASTGGTGGQAAVRPGARSTASVPSLPTAKQVSTGMNPAAELISKRKKLGLDDATVAALTELSAELEARLSPSVQRYDSLRTQVQMARNRTRSGMAPSTEEQQVARERAVVLVRTMAEVRAGRAKDVEAAIARVPEEKRAAAQAILDEQLEELTRNFRRAGPEGQVLAGPPGAGQRP